MNLTDVLRQGWKALAAPWRPATRGSTGGTAPDDYHQLAQGLGQLLSRCSCRILERQFPASHLALRALRVQLRAGQGVRLPARVLNDLAHEIAVHADARTRAAALRCLRRAAAC